MGTVIGLGNTGAGRVLVAFRDEAETENLLQRHHLAQGQPPLDREAFLAHVARVREWGYEQEPSATAVGVTNLSYPIQNSQGNAVAVLNCPFLERIDDLEVPDIEETHSLYQSLVRELTEFYSGSDAI